MSVDGVNKISVAIDGPAGAGKSSVAKKVAADMGYIYIDTGAMYRSVAVYAIENGIDTANEPEKVIDLLESINIGIKYENGMQCMFLNGRDVTTRIRENDASMGASAVAVIPQVRERLVRMQQEMAADGGVVMDGRDITTTVLPNAELKIYLTASAHERAMRRYKEYLEKGIECDLDAIEKDIIDRDYRDMNRETSPLKQADDAVLLDSSELDIDGVVEAMKKIIEEAK